MSRLPRSPHAVEDLTRVLLGITLSLSHTLKESADRPVKATAALIRQNQHWPPLPHIKIAKEFFNNINVANNNSVNQYNPTEAQKALIQLFFTTTSALSSLSPIVAAVSSSPSADLIKNVLTLTNQLSNQLSPSFIQTLLSTQPFIQTTPPPAPPNQTPTASPFSSPTDKSNPATASPPPHSQSSSLPLDEIRSAAIAVGNSLASQLPSNLQSSLYRLSAALPTNLPSTPTQVASITANLLEILATTANEVARTIQTGTPPAPSTSANTVTTPEQTSNASSTLYQVKQPPIVPSTSVSSFSPSPTLSPSSQPSNTTTPQFVTTPAPIHFPVLSSSASKIPLPSVSELPPFGSVDSADAPSIKKEIPSRSQLEQNESLPGSVASPSAESLPSRVRFSPRERRIPSTPIGRIFGFGGIAVRMVTGSIYDATRKVLYGMNKKNSAEEPNSLIERTREESLPSTQPLHKSKEANQANDSVLSFKSTGSHGVYQSSESFSASPTAAAATINFPSQASHSHHPSFRSSPPPSSSSPSSSSSSSSSSPSIFSHLISESSTERLAEGLCRMRGAALKVGQMLSIQDESLLPPQLRSVLDRVRDGADVMPRRQLEKTLVNELGSDWMKHLKSFDWNPIAAASIGQVHQAVLTSGERVVMKVQYPGVADSINSDVNNVKMLVKFFNVLPPGAYLNETMNQAKEELALECDYLHEKKSQDHYKQLLNSTLTPPELMKKWYVPKTFSHLTTKRVLTSEFVDGLPINQLAIGGNYPVFQSLRNEIASSLLHLCLIELFIYRFMQTDPNWSNFLYDSNHQIISLIDFGACRHYPKLFVDEYIRMVYACAQKNREGVINSSLAMGFLTGEESKEMLNAHVEAAFIIGEPFATNNIYDFSSTNMTGRVAHNAGIMLRLRLTPPPKDSYTLHRKLSGCFLTARKLGAKISCRDLFMNIYNNYKFG